MSELAELCNLNVKHNQTREPVSRDFVNESLEANNLKLTKLLVL